MAAILSWPQCAKQKLYLKPQNMKNIKHFKFYSPWAIYTCLLNVYSRYLPLNNLLQVLNQMPQSSIFLYLLMLNLTSLAAAGIGFFFSALVRVFAIANLFIALTYVFMMVR